MSLFKSTRTLVSGGNRCEDSVWSIVVLRNHLCAPWLTHFVRPEQDRHCHREHHAVCMGQSSRVLYAGREGRTGKCRELGSRNVRSCDYVAEWLVAIFPEARG